MRTCRSCRATDLFEMDLTVGAAPVRFAHCRACEHRWWTQDSGAQVLGLREVLAG